MDTLHDRLAELADDAPTGGVPAAELWARGKRAHRRRAAALAATLLVVGAVGTGIGVRLADGDGNRSDLAPAGTVGIGLPIEYPVGEELPDLGNTPGPLAAIWMVPRVGGGAPEAVGLVAETGTFGTLPINLPHDDPEGHDVHGGRTVGRRPQDRLYVPVPEGTDRPRSGERREILAHVANSRPAMGSTGSMPPTSSATFWRGLPTETDGCGSRARRRSGQPLPCAVLAARRTCQHLPQRRRSSQATGPIETGRTSDQCCATSCASSDPRSS